MKIYAHFNDKFESAKLESFLEKHGHAVTHASGEASLQLMEGYFDVALVHGYYHQNNVTGEEIIANIRHMDKKIPTIFFSVCEEEADSLEGKFENVRIFYNAHELKRGLAKLGSKEQQPLPGYSDRLIPEFII